MLCGIPPFYNENLERMYELIKLSELRFPKKVKVSLEAQDLIRKVNFTYNLVVTRPKSSLKIWRKEWIKRHKITPFL
jgi:hypothetical protein